MVGSYQSSIVRFSLGMYCKQERLIQALGNGTLRATRPRFSRLAASLLATRVLRLLPAINFDEKITLHLPFCQQCQARILTLLFVRSSFSYLLLAHVFLINKKLERASIRAIQLETVHVYEQRVALEWEFSFPLPLSRHLFLYLFTIFIVWMVKYY